jgi:cytochrome c oxidase subunit I
MHDVSAHAAHHAPPTSFIRKHVFSLDHKVIGKQYYALALLAAIVGMILSWLMRIHLAWTNAAIPGLQLLSKTGAPGGVMTPEYYLQLMTMHGTIMVFFVLTTAPFAAFGNFFLPIQVGAEDMPFPHFNMMSFWVTFTGFLVLMSSFFVSDGPTLGGWTQYAPLNAVGSGRPGPGYGGGSLDDVHCTVLCWPVVGLIELHHHHARSAGKRHEPDAPAAHRMGMVHYLMHGADSICRVDAGMYPRHSRSRGRYQLFCPSIWSSTTNWCPHSGGSTLLWQHLFWFFGHPEVYIAIVPGIGIVSHILITNMRRPMLSQRVLIYSMGALAVLSYMVYGHHMFVSGMNPYSSLAFSFPTLVITIPSTIVVLIWTFSLYGSKLRINSASLFALGFISMFVSGGVSGFFLAQPSIDIMLHATYFVVGHFHLVMGVAAMFGIFAGTYFWFPKMFGRMMNETLGKIHFWLSFVGAYCIFMPFHYLGMAGNVRRYSTFVDDYLQPLIPVHRFITVAALVTGAAQLIFLYNLIHSRFWGKPAPDNPWEGTSLEWSTATPPPFDNFGGKHPVVYHDPYQYGVQSSVGDYVMQASPEQVKTEHDEK